MRNIIFKVFTHSQAQKRYPLAGVVFPGRNNARVGKSVSKISQHVMDVLVAWDYPGNVRELKNLIERAVIISENSMLKLPRDMNTNAVNAHNPKGAADVPIVSLDSIAKEHIMRILDHTSGRIEGRNGACEILQVKPSTLRYRMKILGISPKK